LTNQAFSGDIVQMVEPVSPNHGSSPIRQFLVVILGMAGMYLCSRILRFTNNGLNIVFLCIFFLLPFLLMRVARRLRGRTRTLTTLFLVPALGISLVFLFSVAIFDIPAAVVHRQLSRELSTLQQGRYSVHLAWEETAGGALGPHGLSLEQRMRILPGLYFVKSLDYFEGVSGGNLSSAGADRIKLHVSGTAKQPAVDRFYSLKPWLYF
jgi:hypothetical protein